jgi:hypothetical protein
MSETAHLEERSVLQAGVPFPSPFYSYSYSYSCDDEPEVRKWLLGQSSRGIARDDLILYSYYQNVLPTCCGTVDVSAILVGASLW